MSAPGERAFRINGINCKPAISGLGANHGFVFHLALADRAVDRRDGVRHQNLGGAVKGFKDGMREGGLPPEEKPVVPPSQVANAQAADKTTIDVEARQKL
jgi:hypothetical protein